MTENKRFELTMRGNEVAQYEIIDHNQENLTVYNDLGCVYFSSAMKVCELLNNLENENKKLNESCVRYGFEVGRLEEENEQLKQQLKRCKDWLNSDKNDYQLTLAFIKNKGYSLKDVLEYEKELEND